MLELLESVRQLERERLSPIRLPSLDPKELLYEKARELSELLAQCDELTEYVAAEEAMLNDPEVQRLRQELDQVEHEIKAARGTGRDVGETIKRMYIAKSRWQRHPRVKEYYRTQKNLETLLNVLNAIITSPITGDDQPTGGGGCGGCGSGGG